MPRSGAQRPLLLAPAAAERQSSLRPSLMAFVPRTKTLASSMGATEYYAYDFFLRETAGPLQVITRAKGWVQLALQMSINVKAVSSAMIAVGAAHRTHSHVSHASSTGLILPEDQTATRKLYSRAVVDLQVYINHLRHRRDAVEPVLLASLLLVCYEVLLDRHEQAVAHCRLGWSIAAGLCRSDSSFGAGITACSQDSVADLTEAFEKLGGPSLADSAPRCSHASEIAISKVQKLRVKLNLAIEEADLILEALRSLAKSALRQTNRDFDEVDTATAHCLTYCLSRSVAIPFESDIKVRLQRVLDQHKIWLLEYSAYLQDVRTPIPKQLLLLRIRYFSSFLLLSTCRDTSDMPVDRFEDDFTHVLDLIEEYLLQSPESFVSSSTTTASGARMHMDGINLEGGILPALRLVAFKSRTSSIRYRALDMLHSARRREGLTWSPVIGAIAGNIVSFEENAARDLLSASHSEQDDLRCEQVPEQARFSDIIIHAVRGDQTMIKLVCARYAHESDGAVRITTLHGKGFPRSMQKEARSFFDIKTIEIQWDLDRYFESQLEFLGQG
jgi:hypothetical protein